MNKAKVWGPFRLFYGTTRWNEKTIGFGGGRGYDGSRNEWYWFIAITLWAVYANVGIKAGRCRKT